LGVRYRTIRADEISESGLITNQIIQHILDDPLVVADLTERNPNVFYELALRHAVRKPLIQIIDKNEEIPFDVAGMRSIPIDHHDLDSVEEAKAELTKQVEALEQPGARIDTPISVAVDLQALRQSEDPGERSLAELLAAMAEMRSEFRNELRELEKRISTQPGLTTLTWGEMTPYQKGLYDPNFKPGKGKPIFANFSILSEGDSKINQESEKPSPPKRDPDPPKG